MLNKSSILSNKKPLPVHCIYTPTNSSSGTFDKRPVFNDLVPVGQVYVKSLYYEYGKTTLGFEDPGFNVTSCYEGSKPLSINGKKMTPAGSGTTRGTPRYFISGDPFGIADAFSKGTSIALSFTPPQTATSNRGERCLHEGGGVNAEQESDGWRRKVGLYDYDNGVVRFQVLRRHLPRRRVHVVQAGGRNQNVRGRSVNSYHCGMRRNNAKSHRHGWLPSRRNLIRACTHLGNLPICVLHRESVIKDVAPLFVGGAAC